MMSRPPSQHHELESLLRNTGVLVLAGRSRITIIVYCFPTGLDYRLCFPNTLVHLDVGHQYLGDCGMPVLGLKMVATTEATLSTTKDIP